MSNTINEELIELASEFAALRQVGRRNWFSETIRKKAIILAEEHSIQNVCQAIKVHPSYFRKKISLFTPLALKMSMTFVEVPTIKYDLPSVMTINIQTSQGHKLIIEGATTSCLATLLREFFAGGSTCCK